MAQTFYPITPTEITVSVADEWVEMDASELIPSDATGVILHYFNATVTTNIGFRKNGSTDDRSQWVAVSAHSWAMIGVDANGIFQAYLGDVTYMHIFVVGYTKLGVTFFTNAHDKSLDSILSWRGIDCSAQAPNNAVGLIFEVVCTTAYDIFGLRKNGSSDNRYYSAQYGHSCFSAVIGCDENQICEGYIEFAVIDFYLVGYITDGVTFNLNATDLSLSTTDEWLDLTALPDERPVMGIIEVCSSDRYNYGLRGDGSTEVGFLRVAEHAWAVIECADRIIEGKIENTGVDFFLVGYAVVEWTGKISGVTNPAKIMGVDAANILKVKGVA